MVLEQHRSSLIPTVSFAAGGRIVVDGDGTFPLVHGKRRERIPDFETKDANDNSVKVDNTDLESFRSYDPKRKPRYLKRDSSQYEKEVSNISGTLSSGGSQSLQRKLRRFRGKDTDPMNDPDAPSFGSLNLVGTMSDRGRTRRSQSYVSPSDPYPGSLGRSSGKRKNKQRLGTIARNSSRKKSIEDNDVYTKDGPSIFQNGNLGNLADIPETVMVREKKIAEETLPSAIFLITGGVMFVLALVKVLLSWWHTFYAPLWTSLFVSFLGISGIFHRGDYLTKWRNGLYILFGLLSIGGTLACSGLILQISGPQVVWLGSGFPADTVSEKSTFTNTKKSVAGSLGVAQVVTLNVGVDFAILALCMASFYSLTATIVAISNHMDAAYTVTGDCDHRGNPRLFNPLEQAILGLIACFIGLFTMGFTGYGGSLYGIPAIAGALVILAGFASFFYGKRPDLLAYGLCALVLEFLALAMCGVATVMLTLALVQDSGLVTTERVPTDLQDVNKDIALKAVHSSAIVTLVFIGLYFLLMIVNVIFASGILFRVCRKACCVCLDDEHLVHGTRF